MMELILLRHGKTEANERHLYCGSTDLPLSEAGIRELDMLRSKNEYPDITGLKLHTSGMLRALQTLDIIYGPIDSTPIPDMRELDFGKFEMHSYDELKEDPEYIDWISDQTGEMPCPGGESSVVFKKRVFKSFDQLVSSENNALIVCHGGVIAELMARLFPGENKNFYEWQPSAGRGYVIRFDGGSPVSYTPVPTVR